MHLHLPSLCPLVPAALARTFEPPADTPILVVNSCSHECSAVHTADTPATTGSPPPERLRLDVGGALDSGGAGNILAWAAAASAADIKKRRIVK